MRAARASRLFASLCLTTAVAAAGGCSEGPTGAICTAIAVEALNVTVLDAASRARICDATVVAVEGGFLAALRRAGTAADCSYAGPTERPGPYEVRASRAGYTPAVASNLRVSADECHVIPVQVTVLLTR